MQQLLELQYLLLLLLELLLLELLLQLLLLLLQLLLLLELRVEHGGRGFGASSSSGQLPEQDTHTDTPSVLYLPSHLFNSGGPTF